MSVANFVLCQLVTPVGSTNTELVLNTPVAPYMLPPVDGGLLVIADSTARPTFVEVISYTHRTNNVLYGVVRAKEGTTARNWIGVTYVYQALTAAQYESGLAGKQSLSTKLSNIAASVLAANKLLYSTGVDTFGVTDLSAFGRSLIDDADATAARATLGAAPLASPAFTGVATVPTPSVGNNSQQIANTAFIKAALDALVSAAPGTLDTLNELAAALGNDPNFATTMASQLALKADQSTVTAGLADKQPLLGYTPVQQGTGVGQGTNTVKIGWAGSALRVAVDATDFASTWPIGVSGNAATATVLQNARTINGVPFNGSANITVYDSTKVANSRITISTAAPSGGVDGDLWFKYE